ncbi:TIGR00730 family Rossman fold protein [Aggregicoccus sp. 17bor-14]|uniref:LOG family protein n=1 Tax=Myxococcaceae TaxID=31 RepID=UPI00129C12A4|nr:MULTISPECIES: TIGR00730 family Rossman fold protein [Myxococcaceae]MBF5045576.1 TIGR00730 family Rossman fold protein [Simulacricoccus sp. 17bor-14]MRI91313.1 TIGR00730 family Rossman fold protein [Aggregicoccus sp. 17bor-14]
MTAPLPFTSVCVFCGSRPGARPAFMEAARAFGAELARRGLTLVYGGAGIGLMGAVADAVLEGGGRVVGVLPRGLEKREIAHKVLTELHVVDSMHARKALMAERAGAFVALPGGYGTFDELFEILTWAQLGLHHKPVGLLDVEGFWQPLRALAQRAADDGFLAREQARALLVESSPAALLDRLQEGAARIPPSASPPPAPSVKP